MNHDQLVRLIEATSGLTMEQIEQGSAAALDRQVIGATRQGTGLPQTNDNGVSN